MERFITGLFTLILALAISIPVSLFGGMVLADMWGWFITPVFTDLPAISTVQGWGIVLVTSYLRTSASTNLVYEKLKKLHPEDSDQYVGVTAQFISALTILLVWGISAFIKFVVM